MGIYWYAKSEDEIQIDSRLIKFTLQLLHKFPHVGIRFYSFLLNYPYLFKGYRWASYHKDHKNISTLARKSYSAEWGHLR